MTASGDKSNLTSKHGVNFASPAKARSGMLNSFAKKWTGEDYNTPRSIGNKRQECESVRPTVTLAAPMKISFGDANG